MSREGGNPASHFIEELLISLMDRPAQRKGKLLQLLQVIPWGHHPLRYIELVRDAQLRLSLREKYSDSLNQAKLKYDLSVLLKHSNGILDLEKCAFFICRLSGDPEITPEEFTHRLNRLAAPIKEAISGFTREEKMEKLETFRMFLFQNLKFRGNKNDYYSPRNSFLTDVMRSKTGNPISLSVLSILVGKKAGIIFQGVNMPGHFIIRTVVHDSVVYLDPFNDGRILTERDCHEFLMNQGFDPSPRLMMVAGNLMILKRMYRNLINYHATDGSPSMETILKEHFAIIEDPTHSY